VTDVLVLSGPAGVGKSSVAFEVGLHLEALGIAHALIDTDELDRIYPASADQNRLAEENLAAVWCSFHARGVGRLILAGVYLDQPSQIDWVARAVPAASFTLVRLRARLPTLAERVSRREIGSGGASQLLRSERQASALSADERDDITVIDTDGRTVPDIAQEVVSCWFPAAISDPG
jgi:hypothetical protein